MGRRIVFGLLILLALSGAVVTWMSRHSFQRETIEVPVPWSLKMLEDDTLFLQKWLTLRGWPSHRGGGLIQAQELPPKGLVILMHLSHPITEEEADTLLAWVRRGGFLLVDSSAAPFNDEKGTQVLLGKLNAKLIPHEEDKERDTEPDTDQFTKDETCYAIRRNHGWRLKVDRKAWDWCLGVDEEEVMVQRAEGRGKITLSSDLSFLYNHQFGELDHAAWLRRILDEPRPGNTAVVWSKPVERALLPWLWQRAWAFLIPCGILLLAWLWRGLWRFGPRLPDVVPARRSLAEHLTACGRFLWRHGGQESLVAAGRQAVLQRAARLHPAFPSLAEEEQWSFLAQQSGLTITDIAEALDDRPGAKTEALARRLQILQHLRHNLFVSDR
jgi:hypothetical protein